jgi:hypothetical protein
VHSANINLTHTINRLAFGDGFPGSVNPLDREQRSLPPGALHQYFLKVVPTTFSPLKGKSMSTNQYSVTERCVSGVRARANSTIWVSQRPPLGALAFKPTPT